jgi:hypothetical protein
MGKSLSKTSLLFFAIAFGCLLGPLALKSFGLFYSGCVTPTDCEIYPPAGSWCDIVYPSDGSTAQNGGVGATYDACAYVYGYEDDGWPCGGAVASDPPGSCN